MSSELVWLVREFIIAVHERLIAKYDGSPGLRDEGPRSPNVPAIPLPNHRGPRRQNLKTPPPTAR